jgi:hypothetical protein
MSKKSEEDTPSPALSGHRSHIGFFNNEMVLVNLIPTKFIGLVARRRLHFGNDIRVQQNRG